MERTVIAKIIVQDDDNKKFRKHGGPLYYIQKKINKIPDVELRDAIILDRGINGYYEKSDLVDLVQMCL